jgi:hypothetical protein
VDILEMIWACTAPLKQRQIIIFTNVFFMDYLFLRLNGDAMSVLLASALTHVFKK